MKKVLVTGAAGFIGHALCERLAQKAITIRVLLRRPTVGPWQDVQIQDLAELSTQPLNAGLMQGIDTVFHLAGVAHAGFPNAISSDVYWTVNVKATEKLFKMAAEAKVAHFIYFSSVKAIEPHDTYGHSKKAAEEVVLALGKHYEMNVCILRPALVYGPNVKGNLSSLLRSIDKGWFPPPPKTQNARSLLALNDLIDAALWVAEDERANGKIYTVTDGHRYSTREIYDAMRKALGLSPIKWAIPLNLWKLLAKMGDSIQHFTRFPAPFNSDKLEKLLGFAEYSGALIQNELGWSPKEDFFTVLPQMVAAHRNK